ncbi:MULTISPECIES: hypothetical protein [Marinobacter]|uniref:Uncharacterized protein n=1 Tax=Marinobacter profundi TaxID=2666256 RepID=A0A2G1UM64_9GAMM|nr:MULTISPECIES: hypothetical protein [Marinobacter]MBD3655147.1 hypothetical protein [Marinobacter sp.]PHQ15587.1 hypothetical protein CLH61_07930 [Marinobacter profundi]
MTDDNDQTRAPGTAAPAKVKKAACGIRFDEDELQEGIDFSAAAQLKPKDPEEPATPSPRPAEDR